MQILLPSHNDFFKIFDSIQNLLALPHFLAFFLPELFYLTPLFLYV
jgi:hypothetical protein